MLPAVRLAVLALLTSCLIGACDAGADAPEQPSASAAIGGRTGQASQPAPAAPERPALCDRAGDDSVRDAFCGASQPSVRSLRELQTLLNLEPGLLKYGQLPEPGTPLDPFALNNFVVALGHSTALAGQLVSPLNPRVFVIGRDTIMAFQRGAQQVELAARGPDGYHYNLYLVRFRQACSASEHGCTPGDLFTPRVELDWTGIELLDAEDLKNTPQDCRQCHQRGLVAPVLLMRELESPWTHFFDIVPDEPPVNGVPGPRAADLVRDYLHAKGDEAYANIPAKLLQQTTPSVLQTSVAIAQPLLFDAPMIEDERWPYGAGGYPSEPHPTPTWQRAYEAFKRGEQLALPYFEVRVTDPFKQAALTEAYQRYLAEPLGADELPDLADIFPDDPHTRAQIGLQTEPDATPGEALIQACGSCHNDVLDQSLSRARFNIDLARLDPAEIALAIKRISLPRTAAGAMPPAEARQLAPGARQQLLDYLGEASRPTDFDEPLARAARLGMSGAPE